MRVHNFCQESWQDWREKDPELVAFMERWADLMEARIVKGETIEQIADETMRQANTTGLRLAELSRGCELLSSHWDPGYSQALDRWASKR